jgi:endonuclease/exonuclease/phosphatase family metal-dependent hydrolase
MMNDRHTTTQARGGARPRPDAVRLRGPVVGLLTLFAAWVAPAAAEDAAPRRTLTFATYNVLAEETPTAARVPPLLAILRDADADVIALQEASAWLIRDLMKQEWVQKGYQARVPEGGPVNPGGQFILSRLPFREVGFKVLPGPQRRTVLTATLDAGGRRLAVATTHMESRLEDGPVRAKQLDAIFPLLRDADDAVLLGDLNFGDGEEPDTSHLDKAFADLWLTLHPGKPGFTWDMEASDMAKKGSFPGEKSRRIDRILVRSAVWQPKSVRIVGDQPVKPGDKTLFPSDHFGVVGTVERRP